MTIAKKDGQKGEMEEPWKYLLQIEHQILHAKSQQKSFLLHLSSVYKSLLMV